jgi:hypothetical protein
MGIRTYLDFSLQIIGVFMEGMSVYAGRTPGNSSHGGPDEAARILVLPSPTIRFCLREVRRSFMCNVKIVQVNRYSVRILIRFLFVVSSSGGNASE